MNGRDILTALLDDMASLGIVPSKPSAIKFDTKDFVRFHVVGDKSGTRNGFFKGFSDGRPAGYFGSWRTSGVSGYRWVHGDASTITAADIERIKELQHQREDEQVQEHEKVSALATKRFNELPDATGTPYSEHKMIVPYHAKQAGTALIVALQDWDGKIWSVQTIYPDNTKRMMKGGRKKGCYIYIGGDSSGRLLICEGFATGCSLRQMDNDAEVISAVDAHNLRTVALSARERFPDREIVICGDNDKTGIMCANWAAQSIGGLVLIPETPGMDWNDFLVAKGGV